MLSYISHALTDFWLNDPSCCGKVQTLGKSGSIGEVSLDSSETCYTDLTKQGGCFLCCHLSSKDVATRQ